MDGKQSLRERLGGKVIKLGLRIMGVHPDRAVLFAHASWDAAATAEWAAKAALCDLNVTPGMLVAVPKDGLGRFYEAMREESK